MIFLAYYGTILVLFSEDISNFWIRIFMLAIAGLLLGIAQSNYNDVKRRVKRLEEKEGADNA